MTKLPLLILERNIIYENGDSGCHINYNQELWNHHIKCLFFIKARVLVNIDIWNNDHVKESTIPNHNIIQILIWKGKRTKILAMPTWSECFGNILFLGMVLYNENILMKDFSKQKQSTP